MKKRDIFVYLSFFAVIASVLIIIRQFILYDVPEFWRFGSELGDIIFDISIGYLVTYWFYYLTVYRREKQYKDNAYKLVNKRATYIVSSFNSLKEKTYNTNKSMFDVVGIKMITEYDFGQVLKIIKPTEFTGDLNSAFQPMTWSDYIVNTNHSIDRALKDIFIVIPYLEPEDIDLFTDLYSSEFLELTKNIPLNELADIGFLGNPMYKFDQLIKKVQERFPC